MLSLVLSRKRYLEKTSFFPNTSLMKYSKSVCFSRFNSITIYPIKTKLLLTFYALYRIKHRRSIRAVIVKLKKTGEKLNLWAHLCIPCLNRQRYFKKMQTVEWNINVELTNHYVNKSTNLHPNRFHSRVPDIDKKTFFTV